MAADYSLDVQAGIVFTIFADTLTRDDMVELSARLRADPDFDPRFSELLDVTELKSANVTYADFNELSLNLDPFSRTSKRAFVAVTGTTPYGLCRMYQAIGADTGRDIQVFGTVGEARRWLGLAA